MRINDRLMTLATGVVLAIGGATASLFLGEDGAQDTGPNAIVVASMTGPSVLGASDVQPSQPEQQIIASISADNTSDVIFEAVEPSQRVERNDVGTDLAQVAAFYVAPQLAMPQDFSNITLTRTPARVDMPELLRTASNTPLLAFDIAEMIKIPTVSQASCALDLRATPIFGARVTLRLVAPCHPNVVVTIKHGGLRFKEQLDENGAFEMKIPAFAEYSRFDIELADGTTSTVGAYIAGLSALERVGIAWSGENDTFLHALENGAEMGDTGHVWRINPNTFAKSRMNGGGYLVTMGDATLDNAEMAQVYTLPQRAQKKAQIVELQVETLRGETACGQDIALRVAHHRVKSGAGNSELSLTLPDCGAGETSLLLKNAFKDMKVARK